MAPAPPAASFIICRQRHRIGGFNEKDCRAPVVGAWDGGAEHASRNTYGPLCLHLSPPFA